MQRITITGADGSGTFQAFHAAPTTTATTGVVVLIQDIFGINDSMKATARVVAAQGYQALASHPHIHAYTYPGAGHAFTRVGGTDYQSRAAIIANGRRAEALQGALS